MWFRLLAPVMVLGFLLANSFAQAAPSYQNEVLPSPFTEGGEAGPLPAGDIAPNTPVSVLVELGMQPLVANRGAIGASLQRQQLQAQQQQVVPQLRQRGAKVLFQSQLLYNAIAVTIPAGQVDALRSLPGVTNVALLTPKTQVETTITSELTRSLTQSTPAGTDGSGVRVGVIDSGIDYTHADFGGAGTAAAYAANNRTVVEAGSFPTAKVAGGFDFAGDAYDASNAVGNAVPVADADPLDCLGRGTQIAGMIAGNGVQASGATFGGPYNADADYGDFLVPPGVAPAAQVYALKVFGCDAAGTTTLTIPALEWALDPNGDGNTADHLDAVLIALGTPFGGADDPDAQAVARAVAAGMVVVAATGDGSGSFFSVNSFGAEESAIAVGASVGSPQPLNADTSPYTDPACYVSGDLQTSFIGNNQGAIVNRSAVCTYQVGMASYRKFDEIIDHQQIFDWQEYTLAPGESILLEVGLPECAVQVDLFRGPVLYSLNGRRYASHLLLAQHLGGTDFCPPSTAPSYGMPATASRGGPIGGSAKPDLVAPSVNIVSPGFASGTGSSEASASWAGAAQVAGAVALLKQLNSGWQPAQIKAALMNTAAPVLMDDRSPYPPSLAGAGQLDLSRLPEVNLVVTGSDGLAVLNYGMPQMAGDWNAEQALHLENTTNVARTFTLRSVIAASEPGVTLDIPAEVSVPAMGSADVPVWVHVDPAALDASPDAATSMTVTTASGQRARYYMAEHSGYIELDDATSEPSRVPFLLMPTPASQASAASTVLLPASASSFTVPLANTGERNNATFTGAPNQQMALASAFELLGASPQSATIPASARAADLQYFGATSDPTIFPGQLPGILYVGFSTYGAWETPNSVQFRLLFDTNADNQADFALVNGSVSDTNGRTTDAFRFGLYTVQASGALGTYLGESQWNTLGPISTSPYLDVAPFHSSVAFAAFSTRFLSLPAGQTQFRMRLESRSRSMAGFTQVVDQLPATGWVTYDAAMPTLSPIAMSGLFTSRPLFVEATGSLLTGYVNGSLLAARGSAQMLLLHLNNPAGSQAQLVTVRSSTPTTLGSSAGSRRIYIPMISSP